MFADLIKGHELTVVLALLAFCVVLFVINRPRVDIIALCAIVVLPLLGLVEFKEAFSGFSDFSIILIALMFVVGEGLVRTGVSFKVGALILKYAGKSSSRLIVFLMIAVAVIGSVMSSTGIVAIFIPIVISIAASLKVSPSKLMMPLSVAGLISGMMSSVATPPNMILNGVLVREGYAPFNFFSFTPLGFIILGVGIVYMLYARRFLQDSAPVEEVAERKTFATFINDYNLADRSRIFRVNEDSVTIGKELKELNISGKYRATLLCIERRSRLETKLIPCKADTVLQAGDIILTDIHEASENAPKIEQDLGLLIMPLRGPYFKDMSMEIGMAEIAIPPQSKLIGLDIKSSNFRPKYNTSVLGIRHDSVAKEGDIYTSTMKMGDTLLLMGPWKSMKRFQTDTKNYILLNMPSEFDNAVAAPGKAPYAIFSLFVMLVLMIGNFVPSTVAALICGLMMLAFKCINMDAAYKSINWQSVVLIVGMMPFALALQKTGGVEIASQALLDGLGSFGPHAVMAGVFALTMCTGLCISNTVTAVLLAPIAMNAAKILEVSPYPFAMAVAIAASTAFMTPVSSPVNTLVWTPGRYKFTDFMKIGIPFSIIVMLISILIIPLMYPF